MFIPLFLHELWSSLSREVAEKEERGNEDKLPVIIQEIKPREVSNNWLLPLKKLKSLIKDQLFC